VPPTLEERDDQKIADRFPADTTGGAGGLPQYLDIEHQR